MCSSCCCCSPRWSLETLNGVFHSIALADGSTRVAPLSPSDDTIRKRGRRATEGRCNLLDLTSAEAREGEGKEEEEDEEEKKAEKEKGEKMYNGIGLTTPRGSGTNGYIQTNKFFVKPRPVRVEIREYENGQGAGGVSRKANKEILEHDRKRQVELKLTELEDQLVEQGYPDDEVLERVEAFRKVLQASVSATEDGTSSASALGDAK